MFARIKPPLQPDVVVVELVVFPHQLPAVSQFVCDVISLAALAGNRFARGDAQAIGAGRIAAEAAEQTLAEVRAEARKPLRAGVGDSVARRGAGPPYRR